MPFEVDEVAREALDMPQSLQPSLTLAEIDLALNRPDVRSVAAYETEVSKERR